MKALLTLAIIVSTTQAFALESFYGRAVQRGNTYTCVYENNTGVPQNMKYVVFNFDRVHGDSNSYDVQNRIDKVVASGATISEKTAEHSARLNFCKYLAR